MAIRVFSQVSVNKSLNVLVFLSLFLIAVLPTGAILGFNIKIPLAVFMAAVWFIQFIGRREIASASILFSVGILSLLVFAYARALALGVPLFAVNSHIFAFVSVLVVIISFGVGRDSDTFASTIVAAIIFSAVFVALLKALVWLGILLGQISIKDVFAFIYEVFGFEFITLETDIGSRLHFPIDYLIPVVLALVTLDPRRSRGVKIAIFALFFLAVLISYSRLLWAFYALTLFALAVVTRVSIKKVMALPTVLLLFLFLSLDQDFRAILASSVGFVVERFFGVFASNSDSVRSEMAQALLELWAMNPIFGGGLGSHAEFVRFPEAPWNYELQIPSMLAQFGVIGFCFLISAYFFYFYGSYSASAIGMFFVFAWLVINSINCFALTSQGGVIMVAIKFIVRQRALEQ